MQRLKQELAAAKGESQATGRLSRDLGLTRCGSSAPRPSIFELHNGCLSSGFFIHVVMSWLRSAALSPCRLHLSAHRKCLHVHLQAA